MRIRKTERALKVAEVDWLTLPGFRCLAILIFSFLSFLQEEMVKAKYEATSKAKELFEVICQLSYYMFYFLFT